MLLRDAFSPSLYLCSHQGSAPSLPKSFTCPLCFLTANKIMSPVSLVFPTVEPVRLPFWFKTIVGILSTLFHCWHSLWPPFKVYISIINFLHYTITSPNRFLMTSVGNFRVLHLYLSFDLWVLLMLYSLLFFGYDVTIKYGLRLELNSQKMDQKLLGFELGTFWFQTWRFTTEANIKKQKL